ncbi:MAG: type II secretion system protein [Synergistota bacterium]|nr:type II secretion system protein [Synergistota bacterium]
MRLPDKKCGFTLVEILIAVAISSIILLVTVSSLYLYIFHFEQTDELTAARQRAETALAILNRPLLQSGMGVPQSSDLFQEAFSGLTAIDSWNGPVNVLSESTTGDALEFTYAMPTGIGVESADVTTLNDGESAVLTLSDTPGANRFNTTTTSTKGWVLLPSTVVPLRITGENGSLLTVAIASGSSQEAYLYQFDELQQLRAMKVWSNGTALYTEDLTMSSGQQPRVEGISGIHFSLSTDGRVLQITLLARGTIRHDGEISSVPPSPWQTAWGFSSEDRHYRLVAVNAAWRIRN